MYFAPAGKRAEILPYFVGVIVSERFVGVALSLEQSRQMLFLYLLTVTVVFRHYYPAWISSSAVFMLSFVQFGIEEAGRIIEDPFGDDIADLPQRKYVNTIRNDIAESQDFHATIMVRGACVAPTRLIERVS